MKRKLLDIWKENKPTIGDILKWSLKSLFITIIVMTVGVTALPPLIRNILGAVFEPVIQEIVQKELAEVKIKISGVENEIINVMDNLEYAYNWTMDFEIDRINKQYKKIKSNPEDIYKEDILAVMESWQDLPPDCKDSLELVRKYEMIADYYYAMEIN